MRYNFNNAMILLQYTRNVPMSDTHQSPTRPQLEAGQIIPAFELPGADGMPYSPWTYKQRENLLLIFIQKPSMKPARDLLTAFTRAYTTFREENCAILAITAMNVFTNLQALETLTLKFPLLADPGGAVIGRYTRWNSDSKTLSPSIVLADRYNALHQQWVAEREEELPPINEILEGLRYLNGLCTP
jgi:peroxiredoxin